MKIRYRFLNKEGRILFCNLKADEIVYIEQINKRSMLIGEIKPALRGGLITNTHGTVYAISADQNYIESSKKFTASLESLANTLEIFQAISKEHQDKVNINTSRLLHNLTTLNAHNIQEIYSLVPQDALSKNTAAQQQQIEIVEKIVRNDSKETAFTLLRIAKNNAAMKTEFSVFKKLFDSDPHLEKKSHNVHKVLMNILYLFFPDFTDKHVLVKIQCPENTMAFFDYESVHVALYCVIENAVKYVEPHTELIIDISSANQFVTMLFQMVSLRIYESEKTSIFNEHYPGELAEKTAKSGSGLGMPRAKNILEINGARISVEIDASTLHDYYGLPYQNNTFKIELNIKKKAASDN